MARVCDRCGRPADPADGGVVGGRSALLLDGGAVGYQFGPYAHAAGGGYDLCAACYRTLDEVLRAFFCRAAVLVEAQGDG